MASVARRLVVPPPRTLAFRTARQQPLTRGQVARTLDDLVQLGFIEKFKDDHNVTRYRPRLVAARQRFA